MNLALWLARSAAIRGTAPALHLGTEIVADYAGFNATAARLGGALRARGVFPPSGGFVPAEIFALARHHGSIHMFATPTMVKRMTGHAKAQSETGKGLRTIIYAAGADVPGRHRRGGRPVRPGLRADLRPGRMPDGDHGALAPRRGRPGPPALARPLGLGRPGAIGGGLRGGARGRGLDAAALDALCPDRIARFKRPKAYLELAELPKHNDGWVLKTELRARLAGAGD